VYPPRGHARLIFLGQDPTIKDARRRASITMVLNLNRMGSLKCYLARICGELGLDLDQHVYATNYLKNFFVEPPAQIHEVDIFATFGPSWLPLLREELSRYSAVPVISLGEPLLRALVNEGAEAHVRHYWGYTPSWQSGVMGSFRCVAPTDSILGRTIFPFPHLPSSRKRFYTEWLTAYCGFVARAMISYR